MPATIASSMIAMEGDVVNDVPFAVILLELSATPHHYIAALHDLEDQW